MGPAHQGDRHFCGLMAKGPNRPGFLVTALVTIGKLPVSRDAMQRGIGASYATASHSAVVTGNSDFGGVGSEISGRCPPHMVLRQGGPASSPG